MLILFKCIYIKSGFEIEYIIILSMCVFIVEDGVILVCLWKVNSLGLIIYFIVEFEESVIMIRLSYWR